MKNLALATLLVTTPLQAQETQDLVHEVTRSINNFKALLGKHCVKHKKDRKDCLQFIQETGNEVGATIGHICQDAGDKDICLNKATIPTLEQKTDELNALVVTPEPL